MLWTILGMCAAVLTMFSFIPQIIKVWKTKHANDVSLLTLCQLALGVLLWIVYGIGRKDFIIIAANVVTLTTLLILIYLYFNFQRRKQ